MARPLSWLTVLTFVLALTGPAAADYGAGARAWNSGQPSQALKHWQAAANAGDSRAMLALGRLYLKGLGAPQDYVLAHMWLNLAASRGERAAVSERDALAARMTPSERAEAQKRARAWRLAPPGVKPAGHPEERRPAAAAPETPSPTRQAIREAQGLLTELGYAPGPVDGKWGLQAKHAYRAYLRDAGRPVADRLTPDGLRALRATAAARKAVDGRPSRPRPPSARDLFNAVRGGDIDGTRRILQEGGNPNVRDSRGWTPLMYTANKGFRLLVPLLLEARADTDLQAADGATALFMAVLQGHEEIAEMLVRAGADESVKGPSGRTPVDVARIKKLGNTFALLKRSGVDRAAFSSARKADTAEAYKRYLAANPRGLFVEEARRRRDESVDRDAFRRAGKTGTAQAHRAYLTAHPDGRYRDRAEQRVAELDLEEFDRAVKANTAGAFRKYLASNPEGMFVEEAKRRGDASLDREAFANAKLRNTIASYETYLAAHPKGAFARQAKARVHKLKDPVVFARAKSRNTLEAYDNYLALYAKGAHADEARRLRDRVDVAGREFRDCDACPTMVVLPAGTFMMGSADRETDERPRHRVTIAEPFAIGKHEVTFGQFRAFVEDTKRDMAENKKGFLGLPAPEACFSHRRWIDTTISWRSPGYTQEDRSPVVCVNWNDAKAFAKWLSRKTETPYRLLSEAEWEYAARANTTGDFQFGDLISTDQANFNDSHGGDTSAKGLYRRKAIAIGSFPANRFGVHDMHGNVLEWVEDCWHDDYEGAPANGEAWIRGGNCETRVARGGSWLNPAPFLRSAFRNGQEVHKRSTHHGFRVARQIDPTALLSRLGSAPGGSDR